MDGLSLSQFEKITRHGVKGLDGRKVLVRAPKHGMASLGESRAYYTVELPNADHDDLWLVPVKGDGNIARSGIDRDNYGYTHGGSLFVAAVDVAKELASALAF